MLRRARPSGWGCCEPRPMSRGYLLVRVDGKPYGLPLGRGAPGAARRIPALGGGRRPPQRHARADPGSRRTGRPHHMSADDDVQLVTFKVAGQDFAFNIFQVERILRYEAPAPLPKAPDF